MNNYGKNFQEQREFAKLSQNQLSKLTGIKQQNISRWENNETEPSITNCVILADFYGITLDELIGREIQPVSKHLIPTKQNIKQIIHDNHGTINNKF